MLIPGLIYRLFCPADVRALTRQAPDDKTFRPAWSSEFITRTLFERLLAAIEIVNSAKS